MHFSHAFVTALTIVATQSNALPLRNAAGPSSGLQVRGVAGWQQGAIDTLTARGLRPDTARESMGIFARYADVEDEHERSVFIARDLSKRGILDTLIQALANIITELLGVSGKASKRDSTQIQQTQNALQQMTGLNFSTANDARESWSKMLDALSQALHQESVALTSKVNSTASANSTTASTSSSVNGKISGSSIASSNGTASVSGSASPNATAASVAGDMHKTHSKRELVERQEGVEGVLQVLRSLVDAILNTLLPMSSRSEATAGSSSSGSSDQTCPPPGTPNNGQYIPGCPGYGRREVTEKLLQVRDAASAFQQFQSLMPLLEELIQRLPEMMGGSASGSASATADGSVSTSSASKSQASGTASKSSSKAGASGAAAASAGASQSYGKDQAAASPMSAAKLSINARSLMEADGFQMEKRQSTGSLASLITEFIDDLLQEILGQQANSTTNATSSLTDDSSSGSGSMGEEASLLSGLLGGLNKRDGGLNISLLNNLLGNLLSGNNAGQSADSATKRDGGLNLNLLNNLLGNLLSGDNASQSADSATKRDGGLNLSLLNNLLGNLLSGDNASQSADSATKRDGGLNLSLLNNLLGNLLSGDNASQSADSATKRDGGLNLNLLNNLLGNLLSGDNASQSADSSTKRDGGLNLNLLNNVLGNLLSGDNASQSAESLNRRADFQPVWTELKKLGNEQFGARSVERRDPGASFKPVWTSFRNMVDDAYTHGLDRRSPLPMPSPKVDTSAFSHATASFIKESIFKQHDRRAIQAAQFQPLIQAAGTFAKSQMQEWTDALNEHSAKHGKIQA